MILVLEPNTNPDATDYQVLIGQLARLPGISHRVHREVGSEVTLTEIYLIGNTGALTVEQMQVLPCVAKVVRVSEAYRVLGRHKQGDDRPSSFEYNGVRFGQDTLNVFAGLCAVDSPESVEAMMKALKAHGQVCTRMGAYKPRTTPYAFQGFGATCLPYVFELAGKYGIKVIAMEVTHESHIDEIRAALAATGNPTGVMLQIGTRNTQNFELLKVVGRQQEFPVLFKRGFGITLDESLNAAEYLATRRQPQDRLLPARHEDEPRRPAPQLRRLRARAGGQAPDAHAGVHRSVALGRHAGAARPTACSTSSTSPRRASSPAPTWCSSTSTRIPRRRWSTARRRCCYPSCRDFLDDVAIVRETYVRRVERAKQTAQ